MSDCPFCERDRLRSITTVKPQFDTPRVMANSTEGICSAPALWGTLNVVMEDGEVRQLHLKKHTLDKLVNAARTLHMLNNQQRVATAFRRRMRSIRATQHLVRR